MRFFIVGFFWFLSFVCYESLIGIRGDDIFWQAPKHPISIAACLIVSAIISEHVYRCFIKMAKRGE